MFPRSKEVNNDFPKVGIKKGIGKFPLELEESLLLETLIPNSQTLAPKPPAPWEERGFPSPHQYSMIETL